MTEEGSELSLATLPSDIIRSIVRMEKLEEMDYMRLISPVWNSIVIDFLSKNKASLPDIQNFSINNNECPTEPPRLYLMVQARFLRYFGVQSKFSFLDSTIDKTCLETVNRSILERDEQTGKWKMKQGACDRMPRLLERCSKICELELDLPSTPPDVLDIILPMVATLPVNMLEVRTSLFDHINRTKIIGIIRDHHFQFVCVIARRMCDHRTMREFINNAIHYANEIMIFDEVDNTRAREMFFGQTSFFWEEFARRLESSGKMHADWCSNGRSRSRLRVAKREGMLLYLLIGALLVSSSTALKCIHNATVIEERYQLGVLVSAGSYSRDFGVLDCSKNLDRCVSFKTMDIAFFKTLDVGKDGNPLSQSIVTSDGKVMGRLCMSQADTDKIQAEKADSCTAKTEKSCYCSTDKCTGNGSGVISIVSLIIAMIYSHSVFQ